jgi:N-terminal domain of anti-restriction factor ArdC
MTGRTEGFSAQKLEQVHARLLTAVAALASSEAWRSMLSVAARFHTYSPNNVLLIAAQRPDATRVAGYRAWKLQGRAVRTGERGIAILAPILRARSTDPDPTPAPPTDTGTARVVAGFRVAHVFDVTQTDGPDLAEVHPQILTGPAPRILWADLLTQVTQAGYTVDYADLSPANGRTDFTDRSVALHHDLPGAQQTKTLLHELAHIRLHAPDVRPPGCDRPRAEIEAESVAYIVTAAHGLEADDYTVPYVTGWAGGNSELVAATATRVLTCARTILRPTPAPATRVGGIEVATDRQLTAAMTRPGIDIAAPGRGAGR